MKRLGLLLLLGGVVAAPLAQAHVRVGISAGYYPAYYHSPRYYGGYYSGYYGPGPGWYAPPPAYYGYGTVYEPPVVVRESPPVVVAASPPVQAQPAVWYFCPSLKAYYPYVENCPEGWATVPATPPDPQGKKKP